MRTCIKCNYEKAEEDFYKNGGNKGICRTCKDCKNALNRASYYKFKAKRISIQRKWATKRREQARVDPIIHAKELLGNIRYHSRKKNIPFSITYKDIPIPAVCPVLGIPLVRAKKMCDSSASVDKIVPELGYVPGNVIVVSCKANRIKSDATIEELCQVAEFYKRLSSGQTKVKERLD